MLLLLRLCKHVTVLSDFRQRRKTIFTHFLHAEASETGGRLTEGVRPQRGTFRLQKLKMASALHSEAPQLHLVSTRAEQKAATLIFTLLMLPLNLQPFVLKSYPQRHVTCVSAEVDCSVYCTLIAV